jgi:hypothetical protein
MACQLRPLVFRLGLNNWQRIGSTETHKIDTALVLDLTFLLNSALKFVPRTMASRDVNAAEHGVSRTATRKNVVPRRVYTLFRDTTFKSFFIN